MSHHLVIGGSEYGKTILLRHLEHIGADQGRTALVCDQAGDGGWWSDHQWSAVGSLKEPGSWLWTCFNAWNCDLIIDDVGRRHGQRNLELIELVVICRHRGHRFLAGSHRLQEVSPTIRAQCGHLWTYAASPEDAKMMAAEWRSPRLDPLVPTLPYGTGVHSHLGEISGFRWSLRSR